MYKTPSNHPFKQRLNGIFCVCSFLFLTLVCFPCASRAQAQKPFFSVIPLGTKGGLDESNLSAYLVSAADSSAYVCLDAGSVRSGIEKALANGVLTGTASSVLKQRIKGYLISHPHLDHAAGLILNSPDDSVKNIYGLPFTLKTLQEAYFTWKSWANFGDAGDPPLLKKYHYVSLPEGRDTALQNTSLRVRAFALSHSAPGQSTAFLIKNKDAYLLYLGDTGPDSLEHSDRLRHLWQTVAPLVKSRWLKAIFIEVSFFNEQPDAQLFGHLTPRWLMREMAVLNGLIGNGSLINLPVVITHSKYFGKEDLELRKQIQKENGLGLKLIFPAQGSLLTF